MRAANEPNSGVSVASHNVFGVVFGSIVYNQTLEVPERLIEE